MIKQYPNISELIKDNFTTEEPEEWQNLFNKIQEVQKKGYLNKDEFLEICMWKSPRPKKFYLSNSGESVENILREVLSSNSEEAKMGLLTSLKGVSIAVASAILTLLNPKDYGVIDIRIWQLLYNYGEVNRNPKGQGFCIADYIDYLDILRKYAREFNVNARKIELIMFQHHKKVHEGNLYE